MGASAHAPRRRGIQYAAADRFQIPAVSGILDHPPSRVMTTEYDLRFSRRWSPEVCIFFVALFEIRGRREDRGAATPAVSRAICANKSCTRTGQGSWTLRPSLRKGALGDVIALTSLDILSECSHLCRDSRWVS